MLRHFAWLGSALAVLTAPFWLTMALAQTPGPLFTGAGQGNYGVTLNSNAGHVSFGGGAPPSLNAACGTLPSVVAGSDSAFSFTSGTSTSATCTITPSASWKQRPTCSIDAQVATQPAWTIGANGAILLSGVADSTTYNVICIGQPGG